MDLEIEPTQQVAGKVSPTPSKFYTQFAVIAALLAEGKSVLKNPLQVDDTRNLINPIETLGATTKRSKKRWSIWGNGRTLNPSGQVIDAKKSIMGLSLLTSISSLASRVMIITGKDQVRSKPVPSLLDALQALGVDVHSTNSNQSPPLVTFESEIKGGKIPLDESIDPRFLPAFLLLTPYAEEKVEIKLAPKFKTPTTRISTEIMEESGIDVSTTQRRLRVQPGEYEPFQASPPLDLFSTLPFVLGAVLTDSELRISKISKARNVEFFTKLLEKMGISIKKTSRSIWIKPSQEIKSKRYSLEELPRIVPFAAVLACVGNGKTRIMNIKKARNMKSDRISATKKGLQKMGADIEEKEDELIVEGPAKLEGAKIDGHEDDAIVAALGVAGLSAEGRTIVKNRAETLRESYTHFVSTFQNLGANMGYKS